MHDLKPTSHDPNLHKYTGIIRPLYSAPKVEWQPWHTAQMLGVYVVGPILFTLGIVWAFGKISNLIWK